MTPLLIAMLLAQEPEVPAEAARLKAEGRALLVDRTRSAQARAALEKAVQLAPGDPEARYFLARWACLHQENALCLTEARAALALSPGNGNASVQLNTLIGIAAGRAGQPDAAEAAFQSALESNRRMGLKDPLAALHYVDFLLQQQRDGEAEALVGLLIERAPAFGPAYLERAKILARRGKRAEAAETAELSLKLRWMDRDRQRAAHALLAQLYSQLGDQDQARLHQESAGRDH